MAETKVFVKGQEFVRKLLDGERDFSNVRLEPYFGLSGDDSFATLQEYLKTSDMQKAPVIFEKADMTGMDADGLYLPYLRANGASFKHATMMEAHLASGQFSHADFRYAQLLQTNMEHADLRNADLRQADLNLALLNNTLLGGANFLGTKLLFTNLQSANIKGIVGLEQATHCATANFQFVTLTDKEKAVIRRELWAQEGKKRRLFGGTG